MFSGFISSGDELLDKVLYTALAVAIVSFLIIFGSPLVSNVFGHMW